MAGIALVKLSFENILTSLFQCDYKCKKLEGTVSEEATLLLPTHIKLVQYIFFTTKKKLDVFLSLIASPATSIPALIVPMYLIVYKFLQHKDNLT